MVPNVVIVSVIFSSPLPLPPSLEHPERTRARDAVDATTATVAVRRENFTVTPLCAWMGKIPMRALPR
jgi:hypothetical protein